MTTFLSALRLSLLAIARNKLRTVLTMLGILIGVSAVVVTTALGAGARAKINDQISALGSNIMVIFPQQNQASGARSAQGSWGARLSEDDVKALVRGSTSIAAAAPYLRSSAQVVYEDRNLSTQIRGTTRAFFSVREWKIERGELWQESSEHSGERICLVGTTVVQNLFGDLDPVGRMVRIGRYPFRVIGVLEQKGQDPFGSDQDDVVMMPTSTFRSHVNWTPRRGVHAIMLSATASDTNEHAKAQADGILRERHHIGEGQEPDFVIHTQAEFRASQDAIYGALSILLLSVGAVSLFVGGIGIMNIMLVSVAERTREIGIRMAVGARERNILTEFLLEAVILALLGGAMGAAVASAIVALVKRLSEWPMRLEPTALGIALLTSTVIGIAFGFFPARRAARLDPIAALHRE